MKTKPKAPYHSESELYMMMNFTPKKIAEYIAQLETALKVQEAPKPITETTETESIHLYGTMYSRLPYVHDNGFRDNRISLKNGSFFYAAHDVWETCKVQAGKDIESDTITVWEVFWDNGAYRLIGIVEDSQ